MAGKLLLVTGSRLVVDPWQSSDRAAAILIDQASGFIVALGRKALSCAPDDAARHDFEGGTLAPSLIDCHVHLALEAQGEPGETVLDREKAELYAIIESNAARALASGTTSIYDQGSPGSHVIEARETLSAAPARYPDVFLSGSPITRPHGHMWYFGGEAVDDEHIRRLAGDLVYRKADFIKIVASGGGTLGTNEFEPSFDAHSMRVAVEVAHSAGLPAMAHASCTESIARALQAGCDLIHHCNFYNSDGTRQFDGAVAETIAATGVSVDPTLWVTASFINRLRPLAEDGDETARAELQRAERHWAGKRTDFAGLMAAGVRIVAGSDAGWRHAHFGETWREVVALSDFGLPPEEAYAAATVYAAEVLGNATQSGRLAVGDTADLLVLPGDPREELSELGRPLAVYHRGQRVGAV